MTEPHSMKTFSEPELSKKGNPEPHYNLFCHRPHSSTTIKLSKKKTFSTYLPIELHSSESEFMAAFLNRLKFTDDGGNGTSGLGGKSLVFVSRSAMKRLSKFM